MDAGLDRRRHDDQRDAARLKLAVERQDRRARIRLRQRRQLRGRSDAAAEDVGIEEAASRQVFDVGPVEQPALTADIDPFVPRSRPAAEETLCRRPQRPAKHRFVLERVLERQEPGERGAVGRQRPLPRTGVAAPGFRVDRGGNLARNFGEPIPDRRALVGRHPPRHHDLDQRHDHDADQEEIHQRPGDSRADVGLADLDLGDLLARRAAGGQGRRWGAGLGHQKMK